MRLIASIYYEPNNYTKSAALTTLITGLEPTIGIINACLPFLPPIAERASKTKLVQFTSSYLRMVTKRSVRIDHKSNDFVRIQEPGISKVHADVEMRPFAGPLNGESMVSTCSRGSNLESGRWGSLAVEPELRDQIYVRKDLSVG